MKFGNVEVPNEVAAALAQSLAEGQAAEQRHKQELVTLATTLEGLAAQMRRELVTQAMPTADEIADAIIARQAKTATARRPKPPNRSRSAHPRKPRPGVRKSHQRRPKAPKQAKSSTCGNSGRFIGQKPSSALQHQQYYQQRRLT